MKKKPRAHAAKSSKKALKNLTPAAAENVKAGRMDAQLNSRSVNPIVVSRDRALNS